MKHTVSTLEGPLLDAAVAKAEGHVLRRSNGYWQAKGNRAVPWFSVPAYSTSWEHGGPIIERDRLTVQAAQAGDWRAFLGDGTTNAGTGRRHSEPMIQARGGTPMTAAMRCRVASKFGAEVDLGVSTDGLQAPGA